MNEIKTKSQVPEDYDYEGSLQEAIQHMMDSDLPVEEKKMLRNAIRLSRYILTAWGTDRDGKLFRYQWPQDAYLDLSGSINRLYRVVGKTQRGYIEIGTAETYLDMAEKRKEFWDKTKYYRDVWIEKRALGPWKKL